MAFSIVASEKEPFLLRVNHQLPGFVGFSYSRAATRALNQGPPSRFISFLNEVREPIVLLCIVDIIESWELGPIYLQSTLLKACFKNTLSISRSEFLSVVSRSVVCRKTHLGPIYLQNTLLKPRFKNTLSI